MILYIGISLLVSIITCILLYIDSRLFDSPKNQIVYVKTIFLANFVTFTIVLLIYWLTPTNKSMAEVIQTAGTKAQHFPNQKSVFIPQIGEEMLTGDPTF